MTAAEVKARLKRRHPVRVVRSGWASPSGWTCLEEWMGIDLLAVSATRKAQRDGRVVA